ncbi:MAG: LysR family transcriptional regulator [Aeromonas sp.]
MLDIHWLNTFATLARLQHFGHTATELHMTQPNVSLHLKRLEQATRVKLIERSPFRLTQAGERLLQSAERTLAELQRCQSDLNAIDQLSQGTLAIAASDIISRLLLIQPFQRFKREFPGIDLTLFNTTSDQAAELVKAGKADLGFVMAQKRSEPLFYTELQPVTWCALGHDLTRWQARAAAGATTVTSAITPDPMSDPLDEPTLILLGHDTRTRALIDPSLSQLALPPYRIMEVGSVDAQLDWAEAGFGVAIVPDFSLHPRLHLTAPVMGLQDFPATSLGYVVRQNQVLSRAIKQLLLWVEEAIHKPHPYLRDPGVAVSQADWHGK